MTISSILKFISDNPDLIKAALTIMGAVIGVLGHFGIIKAAATAKAKSLLADGKTVSEITDLTRLLAPEVEKIAARVAKK